MLKFVEDLYTKFITISDVRPARRHGNDNKEVKRDRSPINDYFDRGRDVTRYPVDPNTPPTRVSPGAPYRFVSNLIYIKVMVKKY